MLDGFTNEKYDDMRDLLNRRALEVPGNCHQANLAQPRWLLLDARAWASRGGGCHLSEGREGR